MMKSVCVYCGSSAGRLPIYAEAARILAANLVQQNLALVYGGGKVGLMGVIADEVMRLGGHVTGVIPQALLDKEVGHTGLSKLHVVANMHERKALMAELSDGFIAMPGGMGTLEELFEVLTWSQLGYHQKPSAIYNVNAYYDGLLAFLQTSVQEEFLHAAYLQQLINTDQPALLLQQMRDYQPLSVPKWLNKPDI
jgi:uncharacterized protein (TIGR00730 family)